MRCWSNSYLSVTDRISRNVGLVSSLCMTQKQILTFHNHVKNNGTNFCELSLIVAHF